MEIGGLPMLNCLLQHTLRSFCSSSDSAQSSAKWVYAVFWRILPRNFPPPKWDYGGCMLDRSKGNKRNWILVWEDGYCDFQECERAGSGYGTGKFGADVFFKMSHEVYNYGEGLVGKVASENGHRWVFREGQSESEANILSAWNVSLDLQPRAWEFQFKAGIQTIAVISVREGIIQLGSLDKVAEDGNLVGSIQRKFSYLQSLPGIFAIQRPYIPAMQQQPQPHRVGAKRSYDEPPLLYKNFNIGWNSLQNGGRRLPPVLPIPPLYPCAEGCDDVDTTRSYVKVSKRNINPRSSGHIRQLQLDPASSVEEHRAGAGVELLEIRMVKDKENQTLDLI